MRTLLLVLSIKGEQYAVLKGKSFTLTNGVQMLDTEAGSRKQEIDRQRHIILV